MITLCILLLFSMLPLAAQQTHTVTSEVIPAPPPQVIRENGTIRAYCTAADGITRRLTVSIAGLDTEAITFGQGPMLCMFDQPAAVPRVDCVVDGGIKCLPGLPEGKRHVCPTEGAVCVPEEQ